MTLRGLSIASVITFSCLLPEPDGIEVQAQTVERSITVGGRTRTYRIFVPTNASSPVPLLLVFHGGGGTGRQMERFTRFTAVAAREHFVAIYPDGVDKNWNDGREGDFSTPHREHIDDIAFIDAILGRTATEVPIDTHRIFATGISNGGFFSNYLAALRPSTIAAFASVVAGLADPFHRSFHPGRPVSVMYLQGTEDPLVPYHSGNVARGKRGRLIDTEIALGLWRTSNSCRSDPAISQLPDTDPGDGCTVTVHTWTGGQGGSDVVLYRIEGGGHTWPGGSQYLPRWLIGRVCGDVDATEVIWKFFTEHPKQ